MKALIFILTEDTAVSKVYDKISNYYIHFVILVLYFNGTSENIQ